MCLKTFGVFTFGRRQCVYCGRVNLARMPSCVDCGQSMNGAPIAMPKAEGETGGCDVVYSKLHVLTVSGTVEPQYSGHSVKQPPHYYNHLAQVPSDMTVYIYTSVMQPPLYYSHNFRPIGDRYDEVPLYSTVQTVVVPCTNQALLTLLA